jgi:prephenate dehydratase
MLRDFFLVDMQNKIAIQGIEGSNHYQVAQHFIAEDNEFTCCDSFNQLVAAVVNDEVDFGIMAIENSIAGSILPNYDLISHHKLAITAEFYLDIKHNLVALKGQELMDIKTVRSHQMALLQCRNFFEQQPQIKLVEDLDTALPAWLIALQGKKQVAALVPDGTAELFDLAIIKKHIQDHQLNATRFVKVSKTSSMIREADKASIRFELAHEPGSLNKVLALLEKNDINMTKIQSVPVRQFKWQYAFFIDMLFKKDIDIITIIDKLKEKCHHFQVLGIYKQAAV